ncbi:TATA element modulatory factor 1 TATA binding domain-containing protein [Hirsutella rhossiliensis]|uniref:TATA element modulatory factor 1 TATA binding domain-containing protein n=1 Tax=Hirsutella rhossiliensis TaxID=111463 RepID=A0A9P8MSJ2_9HYPO|nr:TATA element modulatory factor 1 TATA binding domain-containing protein [Hirsutella rhossiliensis]KAH0960632.1 TATA element modulatory factor 1 TATA binding domain-containing protein [Hirsutella rhossiliensis]
MAAPGKPSKWGSFLSQAVAGVESRLDNILAETDNDPRLQGAASRSSSRPAHPAAPARPSPANSPPPSGRANGRLQARLARAMAASRGSMERTSTDKEEPSTLSPGTVAAAAAAEPDAADASTPPEPQAQPFMASAEKPTRDPFNDTAIGDAALEPPTAPWPDNLDAPAQQQPPIESIVQPADLSDLAKALEEANQRQQEEIQEYVERIDSLQSKIQYLSKNAIDAAKQSAASAPSGSLERKLAEKDEKIALLMDEGQKLSGTEQKFRAVIKKLRLQMAEHEKQVEELRKSKEKATSEAKSLRNRLNGVEGDEKHQEETRQAIAALQREVANLKRENTKKDEACRRLEQEMKIKAEQAEAASADALSKALAAEREKQKELEDTIAALQTDKEVSMDKARQESIEWSEKLQRAAERGRIVEQELQLELRSMESKLEAMRTVAEEASSGSGGEAQVKMFRQIETLQSQYASAQENWQGIESSLLAKAASLERERDEAQRRESEMRKKARDAASRGRHLEDELQHAQPALAATRQELEACRDQLTASNASRKAAEEALEQARADLDKEKQRTASRDDTVEAERRHWVDDVAGATFRGHQSRPDSPLLAVSRTFSSELIGLPVPGKLRRVPTPAASIPDSPADLMSSMRRLSSQPPIRLSAVSSVASGPLPVPFSPFEAPSESPTAERDNGVDDTAPSSPRNLAQDMVSASTVAAGPSVQLVERMSAAIRRLEAEKVAAKEEMARVCNQRDEARADMVGLMKDLAETKTAANKVPQLQEAVSDLDSRYQTTLEMLGEKSELVEELKADVEDVKTMYRELVERTVR